MLDPGLYPDPDPQHCLQIIKLFFANLRNAIYQNIVGINELQLDRLVIWWEHLFHSGGLYFVNVLVIVHFGENVCYLKKQRTGKHS
jgi:hypothetical protein